MTLREQHARPGPAMTGLTMTVDADPRARSLPSRRTRSADTDAPLPHCLPVALRGKIERDGYTPENWAWRDLLTKPDDETHQTRSDGRLRPIGRDPMEIHRETLTAAGHAPRRTSRLVAALEKGLDRDLSEYGLKEYRDLRRYCLDCTQGPAEVRRCAIINCPLWPYRMGRNPHNPQRGINPFKR
jgi:hypothetical protein